jgi:hypothetical protein
MQVNSGQAPNTFAGYTSAPGTAHNSTSRQCRRERRNPSLRSVEPALQQRFQQGIDQAQRQPLNINESQHYRVPAPAPPNAIYRRASRKPDERIQSAVCSSATGGAFPGTHHVSR